MGTDPPHQKRGAATRMVQWGLEHCRCEGVSAYLESTIEAAALYRKNGFQIGPHISLELAGKREGCSDLYEEYACIFEPVRNPAV